MHHPSTVPITGLVFTGGGARAARSQVGVLNAVAQIRCVEVIDAMARRAGVNRFFRWPAANHWRAHEVEAA